MLNHPLGASLAENRGGNIRFTYVCGEELDTPTGRLDVADHELTYRSRSLLLRGQGTALVGWPAGRIADPTCLTNGWIGSLGQYWASAENPEGPQEFVWEFNETRSVDIVRVHQNPVWPAKEVAVLVSDDGDTFREIWSANLDGVPEEPGAWAEFQKTADLITVGEAASGAPVRFLKLEIRSGYRSARWGLDALEVFAADVAYSSDGGDCSVCENLSELPDGPLFAQLMVADGNATVAGEIIEIVRPPAVGPAITGGRLLSRSKTQASASFRVNAMGCWTTLSVQAVDAEGRPVGDPVAVCAGKWPVARDAVVQLSGPQGEASYRAVAVARNESGESAEFTLEIPDLSSGAETSSRRGYISRGRFFYSFKFLLISCDLG